MLPTRRSSWSSLSSSPGTNPTRTRNRRRSGSFAHLGFEVAERSDIDDIAALAEQGGWLATPPLQLPYPIGYICMVRDPDGNTVEFSHDQGVYEFAQEHFSRAD